jgi:hypothetical protein
MPLRQSLSPQAGLGTTAEGGLIIEAVGIVPAAMARELGQRLAGQSGPYSAEKSGFVSTRI